MWDWNAAAEVLPKLLSAMKMTIYATVVGFLLAAILGLIFALLRRSKVKVISLPVGMAVEFIKHTPLLAQLYLLFYAFYDLLFSSLFVVGVVALGLHYSSYLSEVYRSGIETVPKGQWEASVALNLSKRQTWMKIILPQAIPPIIPVLGNYFIMMFKETPILSAIALIEMLQAAKIFGAQKYSYIESFTLAGILFLLLSYPSSILVRKLELRMNRRQET